ncbi:MAG: ASCH domain-containing protein [Sphingomonas sp.]|uniref:ASCH domain-containing protein n=1 Tax=Sphingomonas sp. TaxID=28214 RepID=UPI0025F4B88A|nr:ASCH domain-containing protein [Sphingomonas sp.]MBX9881239.1 ASCH domain-containing protein [Sphingomonas sp.]
MKALTLWQPWASLVIEGCKPFEFRSWHVPRSIIGQRIVIHAAAREVNHSECVRLLRALQQGGATAAETCLISEKAIPLLAGRSWLDYPLACGLGTAIVGEPRNGIDIAEEFGVPRANDSDRDQHANWGWPMLEIERWEQPIRMRGAQGLWNWPTPAEAGL